MQLIGKLAKIHRYPVKSMAGEEIVHSRLTSAGLESDRRYAFDSTAAPAGMLRLSGRERRAMLDCQAAVRDDGSVEVRVPEGQRYAIDSPGLLAYLESRSDAGDGTGRHSRFTLTESPTPQTDVRPLALISLQTLSRLSAEMGQVLDPRRFRANLLVDLPDSPDSPDSPDVPGGLASATGGFPEDALVGRTLCLGAEATGREARILVQERDPRCRFITYDPAAPLGAEPLFGLMKLLDRNHQGRAGVYATVLQPGPIVRGDTIWLCD